MNFGCCCGQMCPAQETTLSHLWATWLRNRKAEVRPAACGALKNGEAIADGALPCEEASHRVNLRTRSFAALLPIIESSVVAICRGGCESTLPISLRGDGINAHRPKQSRRQQRLVGIVRLYVRICIFRRARLLIADQAVDPCVRDPDRQFIGSGLQHAAHIHPER